MLHGRTGEPRADAGKQALPFRAVVAEDPYFDQLMGRQCDIDFMQNRRRKPVLTHRNDGMEMMRFGTQRAALAGGEFVVVIHRFGQSCRKW